MNLLRRACSSLRGADIMTSTVSAAGLMEPRHRYAWTAGCRTPDSIRMPLDGLLKAAEKEELLLGLSSLSRISRNSRKKRYAEMITRISLDRRGCIRRLLCISTTLRNGQ